MAWKFWKRDSENVATQEQEQESNDALSDILEALISGDGISRAQALTIPSVASNTDLISSLIASMPVKLYKKKKDDKGRSYVEEVEGDTRTELLNLDTGDTLDAYQLKKAMIEDYLLSRGGYCFIERFKNEVISLYYVEEEYLGIDYDYRPIHKNGSFFVEGKRYYPFQFIKLLRNTKNGMFGEGIITELNQALENAYQTQLYQLGLVKSGGNKKGFLKSERKLGEKELTALKQAWKRLYQNNNESVMVLNNGIDFKEASNTSVEMQLNETVDNLKKQIDDIFHIKDNFYDTFKFAIYPIVKAFETALNSTLLLEKEKSKYFFEFDVKEVIRANVKERFEVYKLAKEIGFMSKNEMRQAENLNRIEGLDVIDFGLGSVLYDVDKKTYYTPNINATSEGGGYTPEDIKTIEEESFIDGYNGTERNKKEALT